MIIVFLPYINQSYVSEYFEHNSGDFSRILSLSKYSSMFGVSYFNTELFYPSLLALFKPTKRNRFDDKGNYTYPITKEIDLPIFEFKALPIAFENPYLEKIKVLCAAHNIKLICYFSPIKGRKVITENSDFTILNHSAILKNEAYFYDQVHVNEKGRQVSSERFAVAFKDLMI